MPGLPRTSAEGEAEDVDFGVVAVGVAMLGHADRVRLEGGQPADLVDPVCDRPLVGGGRGPLLEEMLLGHLLVHRRAGGQGEGGHELVGGHRCPRFACFKRSALPAAVRR